MLHKILKKRDYIIFTGVGKSGHIARLFNASMQSIGFNSSYLDITDALHGDVGIFFNKNIKLIAISKSGESIELLSNGFKCTGLNSNINETYYYMYMAFAEHPAVGENVPPATAR